jgi:hypothetical protein
VGIRTETGFHFFLDSLRSAVALVDQLRSLFEGPVRLHPSQALANPEEDDKAEPDEANAQ